MFFYGRTQNGGFEGFNYKYFYISIGLLIFAFFIFAISFLEYIVSDTFNWLSFAIASILTFIFFLIAFIMLQKYSRALRYFNIYCNGASSLQAMSDVLYLSKEIIVADIESLARSGFLVNARFDQNNNLVFTPLNSEEEANKMIEAKPEPAVTEDFSYQNALQSTWGEYIKKISLAEKEFRGQDISYSLHKINKVLIQLTEYLSKHANKVEDVKKLLDFHLPALLKVIDAYRELSSSGLDSVAIVKTKNDVLSACDKVEEAFKGVLKSLYDDVALDISADISVLKLLLAKDGFLDRDLFSQKK